VTADLPLFPTSLVGSLPRPRWLIQVLRDRDQGNIPDIEWQGLAEHAVRDAVQLQESVGLDIIGDGEQRRDGFLTFVQDRLFGLRRMTLAERIRLEPGALDLEARLAQLDVPLGAIKSPIASDTVRVLNPHKGIVLEEVDSLTQQTPGPIRVTLPGPYTLSRTLWNSAYSGRVYESRTDLADDLVKLLRAELDRLAERGVLEVQIDEPGLAWLSQEPWESTFAGALLTTTRDQMLEEAYATAIINDLCEGIHSPSIWLHVSRTSWTRARLPTARPVSLYRMTSLAFAANVAGVGLPVQYLDDAGLVALGGLAEDKRIALGVVAARSDSVESPQSIVELVKRALRYMPAEQIHLTPDMGFAPFFERNLNTLETSRAKLESMVEAARRLREM
jgi:5-methyltetrahydropteroyltriglutamate--homocysteine methyltransferase